MHHRKHPIELRVPGKNDDRGSSGMASYNSQDSEKRPEALLSPELSPRASETYSYLTSKGDPESSLKLIQALKSDKQALKDALRTAITKRDELNSRLQNAQQVLNQEAKHSQHLLMELSHSEQVLTELSKELDIRNGKVDVLQTENERLRSINEQIRGELEQGKRKGETKGTVRQHQRIGSECGATKQADVQHEINKYGAFILAKLTDVPELQALFRGRAYSSRYFKDVVEKAAYPEAFLTMLQFISDILVYETHKRKGAAVALSPKAATGFYQAQHFPPSANRRSSDMEESTQQSDTSAKKSESEGLVVESQRPLQVSKTQDTKQKIRSPEPHRIESPTIFTWRSERKFSKESRSAGNSPTRPKLRPKEPVTPNLPEPYLQLSSETTAAMQNKDFQAFLENTGQVQEAET